MKPTIVFVLVMCFGAVAFAQYIGCYEDKAELTERDLSSETFLNEDMTTQFCEEACGARRYSFFALQMGEECRCGNAYGKYEELPKDRCGYPCGGNKQEDCGGELANSVHRVPQREYPAPPLPTSESGRPLLALVMIVKNEAHTLGRTLLPLRPFIDYYYILDTGSTDGTQQVIRDTLGPRGEVHEEPFIDYGTSRNRVLDIALQSSNPPIFSFMLSADETVYNAHLLRQFCEENHDNEGGSHEAYPIMMDVGWRFDSLRLIRTDKRWRYVGRVHEYLAAPDKKPRPPIRIPKAYIQFRATDHDRRSQREYTILKILLEETEKDPADTRASFYLARTYNLLKNHTAALAEFERRITLGGWQEEVYESLYAIAYQKQALDYSWAEVQQAFLDAHLHSPHRAEPLYAVANHWYNERKLPLAFMFALRASQIPYPSSAILWVQAEVYKWMSHFLVGMAGFRIGEYEIGARSMLIAAEHQPQDSIITSTLEKYRKKLGPDTWARLTGEGSSSREAGLSSTSDDQKGADQTSTIDRTITTTATTTMTAAASSVDVDESHGLMYVVRVAFITVIVGLGYVVLRYRRNRYKLVGGCCGELNNKDV